MATAAFTTVESRVDQQLTNTIWADEIKDNINQLGGAHRQLLVNGGFEYWQRGAGSFTAPDAYGADRWQNNLNILDVITVTKETSIVDGASVAALKTIAGNLGASPYSIRQTIEDYAQLKGKTVSFSVRVQQNVASSVSLKLDDGVGSTTGSTVATTGSYVTLTVTHTLNASATRLFCDVVIVRNTTTYLDNAMLVVGPAPAPYRPLHPQEELARCQRYYEVHGGVNGVMTMAGYNAAGAASQAYIPYAVPKGGTPTVTKNGTWGVVNCGQPTIAGAYANGYSLQVAVTALGSYSVSCNSSDDNTTSEWNPP